MIRRNFATTTVHIGQRGTGGQAPFARGRESPPALDQSARRRRRRVSGTSGRPSLSHFRHCVRTREGFRGRPETETFRTKDQCRLGGRGGAVGGGGWQGVDWGRVAGRGHAVGGRVRGRRGPGGQDALLGRVHPNGGHPGLCSLFIPRSLFLAFSLALVLALARCSHSLNLALSLSLPLSLSLSPSPSLALSPSPSLSLSLSLSLALSSLFSLSLSSLSLSLCLSLSRFLNFSHTLSPFLARSLCSISFSFSSRVS